jgi:1-aminocyclopropane-1-carboxylate deaminase
MQLTFADKHKVFIQKINFPQFQSNVDILRLDAIHPIVSGNKLFKLGLFVEDAVKKNYSTIATFGGAYSNHILATAYTCNSMGLKSVGIIRGEESTCIQNNTIKDAQALGMQFHFIDRAAYSSKQEVRDRFKTAKYYWIEEGGYGNLGAEGAKGIYHWIDESYTDIVCAFGTGTTLAGLIKGCYSHQKITGICVLKGYTNAIESLEILLSDNDKHKNYEIIHEYHLGGYAKYSANQLQWMNRFFETQHVPTDIVYTSKLCIAVEDLLGKGYFHSQSKILIIHSGGLQGNRSLRSGELVF